MSEMNREQQPQMIRKSTEKEENEKVMSIEELLPLESSPYVKYKDLEDYKSKAYGTQGHLQPKLNQGGGGGTDAPTLSGTGLPEISPSTIDVVTNQGLIRP